MELLLKMNMKNKMIKHVFVSDIPEMLEEGIIYISLKHNTALHKCAYGCGEEVVTPISPNDWKLTYDGRSVTLYPSIGNWNFKCRSHYWLREGKIIWAEDWSVERIARVRNQEKNRAKKNKKVFGTFSNSKKWSAWLLTGSNEVLN